MEKFKVPMEKVTSVFKWIYLLHIMMAGNSVIYDTPILKITSTIVLLLGMLVIMWRVLHIKEYMKYPFAKLYVLFLIAFAVTLLVNFRYGWTSNLKILIWMTFQFVILYAFDLQMDKKAIQKEFHVSLAIIISYATIINVISIVMLFMNYLHYRILEDGTTFLIGVAFWGRLYGVHADPNYGAIVSAIAIMSAIYLFILTKKKWLRVLLGISIFIQLTCMAFSASRTGMVTVSVALFLFFMIRVMHKQKKLVTAVVVGLLAVGIAFGANKGIVAAYNQYTTYIENSTNSGDDGDETDNGHVQIGRDEELSGDISNRRFDLWKNALDIAKTSPIVGIGYGNIVSYAKAELPDCYLLTNGFSIFDAFHNMFMDLTASQGITGIVLFFSIIISSLIYLWKNREYIPEENKLKCTLLFSCCAAMFVSSMFVSEILYVNIQTTVVFWTLWGYLLYYVTISKKETN